MSGIGIRGWHDPHWRDAQTVVGLDTVVATHPAAIDPNLARSEHFVDPGLGNPL